MLIHDTHAHLDYLMKLEPKLNISELLSKHEFWLQPGVNNERDRYCLENYMQYPNVRFMLGAHPGEVKEDWDLEEYLIEQQTIIQQYEPQLGQTILAIGEIGLDYRDGMSEEIKEQQKLLFNIEIKLAKELNLPFVVHCRDAWDDTLKIIEENLPLKKPFLIHCFTGNKQHYESVIKMGGYVAFGGIITYNNTDKLQEVVLIADKYVVETDLPWLAPVPYRGKTNMPIFINQVIEYIAAKKGISKVEVLNQSKENAIKIFGSNLIMK
jgi:TatD DNase family protein